MRRLDSDEIDEPNQRGGMAMSNIAVTTTAVTTTATTEEDWHREHSFGETYYITATPTEPSTYDELFLRWVDEIVNTPMQSSKNLSPKRVKNRRKNNKATRQAKRRNRKRK